MNDDFDKIAEDAIRAAEQVKCSLSEFAEGLDTIRIAVTERRDMAREEAGRDDG